MNSEMEKIDTHLGSCFIPRKENYERLYQNAEGLVDHNPSTKEGSIPKSK